MTTEPIRFRHTASIAGLVSDGANTARLAGALVEIVDGPPAYRARLAAIAADPEWRRRAGRPDRAYSQHDGIFVLVDLPPGDYRLRVSVPDEGSRYGVVEAGPFAVPPVPDAGPYTAVRADVAVPPTRIHGTITRAADGAALPAARVRLLGDTAVVRAGDDGTYELTRQVAGKPTIQVTAARFKTLVRQIQLAPGQDRSEDFALQPE
jgi:hypothetical protein